MSAATVDERLNAKAQLEHFAQALYADPAAALTAMRNANSANGPDEVRRLLEEDFRAFGEPSQQLQGPEAGLAQRALNEGDLAADVEKWLRMESAPAEPTQDVQPDLPAPEPEAEAGITNSAAGITSSAPPEHEDQRPNPEAAESQRLNGAPPAATRPATRLTPEEVAALEHVEAYAAAKERADLRAAAEARLHAINDHRAHLKAAEDNVPAAEAALKAELPGTYRNPAIAHDRIQEALQREGPTATARRIRAGELLSREEKKIYTGDKAFGIFPLRNHGAEAEARERVAQRIETIGMYKGELGEWGTYQPQDGPRVEGAQNVKAALDREEAKIIADSGIRPGEAREIQRSRPAAVHPSVEADQLERSARAHLDSLSPASRERVVSAARAGSDRVAAAIGHLQTLQMATRTIREGIEGPVH